MGKMGGIEEERYYNGGRKEEGRVFASPLLGTSAAMTHSKVLL